MSIATDSSVSTKNFSTTSLARSDVFLDVLIFVFQANYNGIELSHAEIFHSVRPILSFYFFCCWRQSLNLHHDHVYLDMDAPQLRTELGVHK
jgi:hypothetical protein